jgi:hypothetical protein
VCPGPTQAIRSVVKVLNFSRRSTYSPPPPKKSGVRIVVRSGMRAVEADVGRAFEIDKALRCPRGGG